MPLTGKYLKYTPKITLEIFTLIWNKLEELGFRHKYSNKPINEFNSFINTHNYLIIEEGEFNTYLKSCVFNNTETTVQEILGYNPFVKDDFVLPKKWCIKSQSRGQDCLINEFAKSCGGEHWSNEKNHARNNYLNIIDGRYCRGSIVLDRDFTEITFEQFKKYVLKEPVKEPKEVIPEYVECIKKDAFIIEGVIYKVQPEKGYSYNNDEVYFINNRPYFQIYFKPSTKEAFDAQNQPKLVDGKGFFVALQNKLTSHSSAKVTIGKIYKANSRNEFDDDRDIWIFFTDGEKNIKWFAILQEAEEFAKTLVDSVKEEVKQPLKQAVHCTTQEEWDFVRNKLNYHNGYNDWKIYEKNSFVPLYEDSFGSILINREKNQILSFQEWCDLNGYKMEKEVKFEVGKWYKYNKWYLKYLGHNGRVFVASEYISDDKEYRKQISHFGTNDESKVLVLIEEIQQYLPDNHPDKIKSDIKFEVGDWVILQYSSAKEIGYDTVGNNTKFKIGHIDKISNFRSGQTWRNNSKIRWVGLEGDPSNGVVEILLRHATPEEINNHLISIRQTPAEKYPFKKLEEDDLTWEIKTEGIRWTEPVSMTNENWKPKMILSTDDEELPMVNIIKTNSIKQLLSDD